MRNDKDFPVKHVYSKVHTRFQSNRVTEALL